MANQETYVKREKRRSKGWIAVLVLLLLLAAGAGYLYYTVCKAPVALDDPQKMASSDPMDVEDRYVFSADGTAQVKLDAADIWTVILSQAGEDFLDTVNQELSGYDLTLSGCGIRIGEEGLNLDLELFFRETRLVAKVPCALEISGQRISLTPTGVKLGVISLPVEKLLSNLNLEYDMSLPVVSDVTQVSYEEGAVVLTGTVEDDIRSLIPQSGDLSRYGVFCESAQTLVDYLLQEEDLSALYAHLAKKPADVEALYDQLFLLTEAETAEHYLDSCCGLAQRFFPGIRFDTQEARQTALREEMTLLGNSLELFFTSLANDYNEKNFRLSDGEFLLNRKPFRAAEYGGGQFADLFQVLDPESFFLILVDAEDGFIRKTSSFYRMADEKQQFTQEVDFNKTYILGCVFRSVDGEPFLMYDTEIQGNNTYTRKVTLRPLTEEAVSALQEPGKFGVWTG